jgi:hypothetical protein
MCTPSTFSVEPVAVNLAEGLTRHPHNFDPNHGLSSGEIRAVVVSN